MENSSLKMNGYVSLSQKDKENRNINNNNNNNTAGRKGIQTSDSQRDDPNGPRNSAGQKQPGTANSQKDVRNGSGSINGSQANLRLYSSEGTDDKYKGKFTGKSTLKNPFG